MPEIFRQRLVNHKLSGKKWFLISSTSTKQAKIFRENNCSSPGSQYSTSKKSTTYALQRLLRMNVGYILKVGSDFSFDLCEILHLAQLGKKISFL